jgi:hypothetical protein
MGSTTPSKFVWPALLGDKLNLTVVNKGAPGASNLEILLRILTSEFKKKDTVVVLWTWPHRDLIFTTDHVEGSWKYKKIDGIQFKRVSPELDKRIKATDFTDFLKVHSDHDLTTRSHLHIQHAILFLNSQGVNHYHFTIEDSTTPDFIKSQSAKYINFDFLNPIDLSKDTLHPGVESQKQIAENIYDSINQKKLY